MRRALTGLALASIVVVIGGAVATRPQPLPDDALAGLTPDPERGALVFAAAGCASCHVAEDGPDDVLSGGKAFVSSFGTFYAPNISPDPDQGIGDWTDAQIASAIMRGVGADGAHLYPAFPYTAYAKADPQDVTDLIAHLRTLPADQTPSKAHDIGFPFNIRATLGVWKALYQRDGWIMADAPDLERGRYLVEALGHCGECHTPRDALGGLKTEAWLSGAPNPSGEGRIPNITPGGLSWSEGEIAEYLSSGFTPDFDTAGGTMAEVVKNTAKLPDSDRAAIAAYLKAVPAVGD
ncbi:c-type cytochrome [Loktanella sp. DJP18]|uniref:c-type cytochrome n=1 Tax=Loktanella sp. DJP18 TaxID=3409788 RepID=UPI003BB6571E